MSLWDYGDFRCKSSPKFSQFSGIEIWIFVVTIHHLGFYGVTTAEKKPMLQPHNVDKSLSKAGNSNLLHMNSDGASKMGDRYLRGADGLGTPDSIALRYVINNPVRCNK